MSKIFTIILSLISLGALCQPAGVAISPNGNQPDSSAGLDVNFTNKGELMPRMSTAQRNAIAGPATGLTIFNTDCNVYNFNAGTQAAPNWATINSSNALMAGVSIFANPSQVICSGTSVTFTAIPSNGINAPNYQWQLNGNNVGTNTLSYTNPGLNNGDAVTCILSTNQVCVTGSPATSNSITMTVNPLPGTPDSIIGNINVCATSAGNIYSVNPIASATSYNWTVPGDASITAGAGTDSITVTFGISSGTIGVSSFNSCGVSSVISIAVNNIQPPTAAYAGPDQDLPGSTTTLAANTPIYGTGMWSIVSGIGGSFSNSASPTSNFTGQLNTAYVLSWTISQGFCGSSSDTVDITFNGSYPAGCALATDGTVWCVGSDNVTTAATLCGYPAGYAGTYYAITDAGAAALGRAIYGYIDCATNYLSANEGEPNEIAGWDGSACWSNQMQWARNGNGACQGCYPVVRCTSYE